MTFDVWCFSSSTTASVVSAPWVDRIGRTKVDVLNRKEQRRATVVKGGNIRFPVISVMRNISCSTTSQYMLFKMSRNSRKQEFKSQVSIVVEWALIWCSGVRQLACEIVTPQESGTTSPLCNLVTFGLDHPLIFKLSRAFHTQNLRKGV
jgi:hypothetical protein